jgi:hypothetical protein
VYIKRTPRPRADDLMKMQILLPGVDTKDVLQLVEDIETICVLTMEDVNVCDNVKFLHDIVGADNGNVKYKEEIEAITRNIPVSCDGLRGIQFVQCKHVFSAVPLLYNIMTTCFKCPICRCGSSAIIDIENAKPKNLEYDVWNTLCVISSIVRRRHQDDRAEEENSVDIQPSIEIMNELRLELSWMVQFSIYNTNSNNGNTPAAVIGLPLRKVMESNDVTTYLQTGSVPPRALSRLMRKSVTYSIQVIALLNGNSIVVHQSSNQMSNTGNRNVNLNVTGHANSVGKLLLKIEICPYERIGIVKMIRYEIECSEIDNIVIPEIL